jgi:phosphatidylglycerol:prolipoprotein diacylglycerol transferase
MFPDILDVGFLHIRTYGLCMAVGFLICWKIFEKISSRTDLSNLLFAMIISGVMGSRIAYVVEHWNEQFAANPMSVIRIDQGGLMFYGGLILAVLVYLVWCAVKKENPLKLGDCLAAVIPLGHAFGRIGCFFYGCCYGKISNSALAVEFPRGSPAWYEQVHDKLITYSSPHSLGVLPTQLFEAAALFCLFFCLLFLRKVRKEVGFTLGTYLSSYAIIRFFIEYLRGDPRAEVGMFSISQAISIAIFVIGVSCMAYSFLSSKLVMRNGK